MKRRTLLSLLFICCFSFKKANAQFYKFFKNLSSLETESSAIELDKGFVFGFTETNDDKNFHENILLIKTSRSGNIIWSKRYDAGAGTSLQLMEMIRTADNKILISGLCGPNNKAFRSPRCIIKLSAAGNIIWAKKYTKSTTYSSKGLAQLKDSSFVFPLRTEDGSPGLIQINDTGKILSTFKVDNRNFQYVNSITPIGNRTSVIVGDNNAVNINFKTGTISGQKQYNTSNQFTSLVSTVCKNGDIVYLAGRNAGGLLEGNSRIFRTTADGNLLWAKNIDAFFDSSNSIFSRFDIVLQVSVHEDINGNIVAVVEAESTQRLMIVFNANGKYLYNRLFYTRYSFLKETTDGGYLHCAPAFNNSSANTILSKRFLSSLSGCDSAILVKITNGTDSAAALNKLVFSKTKIKTSEVLVSVRDTTIQTDVFCDLSLQHKKNNLKNEVPVAILPNPATNFIVVRTSMDLPFDVYSIDGILKMRSVTNHSTDISNLKPGVYVINVLIKDKVIRKMMIKR
ncbi:MAG TPA: T9SS type A sorting domain-containing protein [Parafilimonas sp.]|nr:T9SS type A sorting domain-containing protein [Parafilimonas sp.]